METESGLRRSREHTTSRSPSRPAPSPTGIGALFFALCLFAALAGFTATVTDSSDVLAHWIGAGLFFMVAAWMVVGYGQHLYWSVPSVCLLLMACYGVCQTIWSPYKI